MSIQMWRPRLFDRAISGKGHGRSASRRRTSCCRPRLEVLEERTLPSTSTLFGAPIASPTGSTSAAGIVTTDVRLDGKPDAVLDFNGDGKADVVTWQSNGNHVFSVLLGKGDGTFTLAAGSPVALGSNPIDAVVGDFNGDGKLDLALLEITTTDHLQVETWLGDGKGGFTLATASPTDLGAYSSFEFVMAAGDFNKDGKLDLAVANGANVPLSVQILTGDGNGGFRVGAPIAIDGGHSIAVGDFNKDGNLDLAVAGHGTVDVLLGDGAGNFAKTSASPYAVDVFGGAVAGYRLQVGDFNNDGNADLVVGGANLNTFATEVQVLLGNGQGGFTVQPGVPVPQLTLGIGVLRVGDFNGDGKQDLVAGGLATNAEVLLGDGTGTFTDGGSLPVGKNSGNITFGVDNVGTGHFNGDGLPDLAFVAGDANVYVFPHAVVAVGTTTQLVSSQNPAVASVPVTLTATVTPAAPSSLAPTGTVTFTTTSTIAGATPQAQTVPLGSNGQATLSMPFLAGSYSISAVYNGDSNFQKSAPSAVLTQTVRAAKTFVWSGRGPDNNWTDAANWVGGAAPLPGDRLVFPADAAQLTNVNDFPSGSLFYSLTFAGGTINLLGGTAFNVTGAPITVGPGGITDRWPSGFSAPSVTLSVDLELAGPAGFITVAARNSLFVGGRVGDGPNSAAGIIKSGQGTLELDNQNAYVGPTVIAQGDLDAGHSGALGSGAVSVRAGASLRTSGAALLSNPLVLAGTLLDAGSGESWTGPIALSGPSVVVDAEQFNDVSPLTLSGTITGGAGFRKTGPGTLILAGHNAYTGLTIIQQGTVSAQNSAALGSTLGGTQVAAGATLEAAGGVNIAEPLTLMTPTARLRSTNGDNVWSGAIFLDGKDPIEVDADQLLISGRISGRFRLSFLGTSVTAASAIAKTGAGTLALANANSLALPSEISEGVLDLRNANGLGGASGGSIQVDDGATLALDSPAPQRGAQAIFSQPLTLDGSGVENQGALHSLKDSTWNGSVHLTGVTFIAVDSGTTLSLPNVSGDSLAKVGGGELDVTAANHYTGDTLVLQGTLAVRNAQALPTDAIVSPGAVLRIQPASTAPSMQIGDGLTLLDGSTFEISAPSGGAIGAVPVPSSITWFGSLTLAGRVNLIVDANASLSLTNFVSGTDGASLVKSGSGSLQLGGSPAATFATVLGPNGPNQIVLQNGALNLNQENLSVSLATGFVPALGQQFTLIDNQLPGGGPSGTFAGLADGSTFLVDGFTFRITYGLGIQRGSKVVITRIA
jgi:autotransporter-associated beta strand protein